MSQGSPPPGQYGGSNPTASPTGAQHSPVGPRMLSDKKAPPPPQDYTGAAEKQAQSSQAAVGQQTQANRPNQSTDFGSTQWTQGPDGNWTQKTSLTPAMQGLENNLTQQLSGSSGADAWKRAFESAYGQETSRLDPMWNQRESALQQQLANQGLDMNSEAGRGAYGNFNRGRNDAYTSAFNNAFGLGQQAQAQNFTEGMAGLSGLHGFQSMPSFVAAGAAQPTQYLPATMAQGNADMQAWQTQQQMWADILKGGAQVGAAAAGV